MKMENSENAKNANNSVIKSVTSYAFIKVIMKIF